ncbi:MAG TPA: efflux RND transporter periplasmic adaptor subunit [Kofleriaceae bacterium]|nr:efflux RND transporter periplasmic adaptor subunit [Kofleriaceae bacterium]
MKYCLATLAITAALGACGKDKPAGPPPAAAQGPVQVGVITVTAQPVTLTRELPGRTSALRVAEVRARVNGIVQKRLFTEGSDVKAGQALFVIDPAPYQAALESAAAQLARAEAGVTSAQSLADRYATLIQSNAISRQEYDDATSRLKIAQADLAGARAAVKTARINLDYTTVAAPIAGRIGRAEVTEGAYVQQAAATLMATVQQLDRVYVDVTVSSADHARMRRAVETGALQTAEGQAKVALLLEDGRAYPEAGALQFADVSVDPSTGSISLRAIFPNPRGELLPGMFVRARLEEGTDPSAILLAQRAVSRDQAGRPTALVVGKDGKVELRQLVTDRSIGDAWLVTSGLAVGEQVIVEGLQKVRPGAAVTPVPAAPATPAAPAAKQAVR